MLAIGAWLVAAGADWRWMTVALIALAAIALITPLVSPPQAMRRRDAMTLNAVTVLTSEGFVREDLATWWAIGALAASAAVAIFVLLRSDALAYPLPLIWGLTAVFVAERDHRPAAAWFAATCALLLAMFLLWRASRASKQERK
jgi:hypothetical protein